MTPQQCWGSFTLFPDVSPPVPTMPVDVLPLRIERASIPIPHPVSLRGESKLCWWALLGKDCGVDEGIGAGLAGLGRNS